MCICLSVSLSVCLSYVYLSICLYLYLPVYLPNYLASINNYSHIYSTSYQWIWVRERLQENDFLTTKIGLSCRVLTSSIKPMAPWRAKSTFQKKQEMRVKRIVKLAADLVWNTCLLLLPSGKQTVCY